MKSEYILKKRYRNVIFTQWDDENDGDDKYEPKDYFLSI